MKRAEMGINVVVAMVLALLVLAILGYIAYKYIGGGARQAGELSSCENQGGKCGNERVEGQRCFTGLGCEASNPVCCFKSDSVT